MELHSSQEKIQKVKTGPRGTTPPEEVDPERTLEFRPVKKLAGFVFNPPKNWKMDNLTRLYCDGYYWIDILICNNNSNRKERNKCRSYQNFLKEQKQ